ncbi:MAG: 2-amino-4-hydroxy-6-hydroxymethyldihydropteridine diphosphokinase [Clostridia bacterium]|nr:2-amino-4-hydroxy-6-hydroxymethyldihydropteridine diphosphokinase [Clostridia bacterium]
MKAVIGLGTNTGDRAVNLQSAVDALSLLPGTRVTAISPVYETEPVGYADQPDFLNAVCCVQTELSPRALLGACLGIEAALGRVRAIKNGPRVIDLDLLLYEGVTLQTDELTLPHPRMGERAFVLCPFSDIFPDGVFSDFDLREKINSAVKSGVKKTDMVL